LHCSDFGAAKEIEGLVAQSGSGCKSLKGTVYWMAPEVIKQSGYGRQADIWSLGCTVIEMATGKPPWSSEFKDQVSALYNIAISNDTPPIPQFLSEQCKDFLMQCFRRNPRERPNAKRLLRHPWLSGSPSPLPSPHDVPTSPFQPPDPYLRNNINNLIPPPAASGPPSAPALYNHSPCDIDIPKTEIQLKLPNDKFKKLPPANLSHSPLYVVQQQVTMPSFGRSMSAGVCEFRKLQSTSESDEIPTETLKEDSNETVFQINLDEFDMEFSPDVPGLVQQESSQYFYTI